MAATGTLGYRPPLADESEEMRFALKARRLGASALAASASTHVVADVVGWFAG